MLSCCLSLHSFYVYFNNCAALREINWLIDWLIDFSTYMHSVLRICVRDPRSSVVYRFSALASGNGISQSHKSRRLVAALPVKSSIGAAETGRGLEVIGSQLSPTYDNTWTGLGWLKFSCCWAGTSRWLDIPTPTLMECAFKDVFHGVDYYRSIWIIITFLYACLLACGHPWLLKDDWQSGRYNSSPLQIYMYYR